VFSTGPFDWVVHPARKIMSFSTWKKNQPPGQIKGLCNGFSIRAPGHNLVPLDHVCRINLTLKPVFQSAEMGEAERLREWQ
jgi:hypothetical protein